MGNLYVAVLDLFLIQNISKSSHGRVFVLRQDLSGIILSGHCDKKCPCIVDSFAICIIFMVENL